MFALVFSVAYLAVEAVSIFILAATFIVKSVALTLRIVVVDTIAVVFDVPAAVL